MIVWAEAKGVLARETEKAVVIILNAGQKRLLIPKSELLKIEYDQGGDSKDLRIGETIRSIKIPAWLAENRDLTVLD